MPKGHETPARELDSVHGFAVRLRVSDRTIRRRIANGMPGVINIGEPGKRALPRIDPNVALASFEGVQVPEVLPPSPPPASPRRGRGRPPKADRPSDRVPNSRRS
jgi:hypothetical protein